MGPLFLVDVVNNHTCRLRRELGLDPMAEYVQSDPPETVLLTSRDAAALLAVCEKTLWTLREDGKIAAVQLGRAIRYSKRDLLAFIEQSSAAK